MPAGLLQVIASDDRRGAEVFAVDLQAALERRGRSVRTVALSQGGGVAHLDVPSLGARPLAPATLFNLRRSARDAGSVVAHGSTTLPACALALAGSRRPFVYRSIGDPSFWRQSAVRRWRVRLLLERARTVVALWEGAADVLAAHGLDRRRIAVIPNGVVPERFPLVTDQARHAARAGWAERGLSVEGPIIAYLGSLSAEKRVDLAVLAVAAVPGAHLVVAGHGPLRAQLQRLAEVEAPGRVHFVGGQADPSLVLALADAVILTSATEGMPAVLIEAGLSGLPVVSTAVGGVGEVVVPGVTGLLVEAGDGDALAGAVQRVISDPPPAGEAARAHCLARFDIDVVAAAWDELLGAG